MQGGGGGVVQLLYMVECERSLIYIYLVCTEPTCMYICLYVGRGTYIFNIKICIYILSSVYILYNCSITLSYSCSATSTFNVHRKEESEPCTVCGT